MPELIAWTAGDSAFGVEFTQEVMEEIRLRALAGYKVLPRTGVGVGGLLLGERSETGIRITGSVELPCVHRFGPGFVLDPHEKSDVRDRIREAGALEAVGWYFSRLRGEVDLTEDDRALAKDLFGISSPVTLIMKPAPDAPVQAALYIPGVGGELERGASHGQEAASVALTVVTQAVRVVRMPLEPLPESAIPEVEPEPELEPESEPGSMTGHPEFSRAMPSFLPPPEREARGWTRVVTLGAVLLMGIAALQLQDLLFREEPAGVVRAVTPVSVP